MLTTVGGYVMNKHHKHIQQLIKSFLLLFIPLILFGIVLNTSKSTVQAADETVVTPKFKPADPPKKFLGIWMSNGYGLQPPADSYTSLNMPVTLRTSAGRSVWSVLGGIFDGVHYRWWRSTDGMLWTAVPEGHTSNACRMPAQGAGRNEQLPPPPKSQDVAGRAFVVGDHEGGEPIVGMFPIPTCLDVYL